MPVSLPRTMSCADDTYTRGRDGAGVKYMAAMLAVGGGGALFHGYNAASFVVKFIFCRG